MRTAGILASLSFLAACGQTGDLEVRDAWAWDTVGGTANAAVFMTIASPAPDRLVGAASPLAAEATLMTMRTDQGAMSMVDIEDVPIPRGGEVVLEPSGLHVWLANLQRPLRGGESFPLVLEFAKAGERRIDVRVISPAAPAPHAGAR